MAARFNARTAALVAVAALLAAATAYDQLVGFGDAAKKRGEAQPAASQEPPRAAAPDRTRRLAREAAELEHFIAAAPAVRARYQSISVPYAEAVAGFATLHGENEPAAGVARERLASLLPPAVKVEQMLVSEPAAAGAGATWLTASLNLSSGDSAAFEKALLKLGDAANGMVWKELAVVADPEQRRVRASGQLALLMIRRAE